MNAVVAFCQLLGDRPSQQDYADYRVLDLSAGLESYYLALADGMGGESFGFLAADLAIKAFLNLPVDHRVVDRKFLLSSIERINQALAASIRENPQQHGMGVSFLAATVVGGVLSWVSVGDSPLYLYQGGTLRRLNQDHSMLPILSKMVKKGQLSEAEIASDPRRGILRSCIKGESSPLIDVQVDFLKLEPRDLIILASDGINTLSEQALLSVLDSSWELSVDGIAKKVLEKVQDHASPNQDNASAMIYRFL